MLFAPTDPGPARPPAPPRAPAIRLAPANIGGTCSKHQTFHEGCAWCDEIIERRREIRSDRVRRDIVRMMGAPVK